MEDQLNGGDAGTEEDDPARENAIIDFATTIGLEFSTLEFMRELPEDVQDELITKFDPSGTKDGNVLGRLQGYARYMMKKGGHQVPSSLLVPKKAEGASDGLNEVSDLGDGAILEKVTRFAEQLGLTDEAANFIAGLPEEFQGSVIRGFNSSGTKDGNVWGRLLGYIRSMWTRNLKLDETCAGHIRRLPEEVQMVCILEYDARGSKDGNHSARLMHFANRVAAKHGGVSSTPQVTRPAPVSHTQAYIPQPTRPARAARQANSPLAAFVQGLELDHVASAFLETLPPQILDKVVSSFDASGTKDGNVWGRLLAFIRMQFGRQLQVDRPTMDYMKTLPDDQQMAMMQDIAHQCGFSAPPPQRRPQGGKGGKGFQSNMAPAHEASAWSGLNGMDPSVEQFAQAWRLDHAAASFIQALPDIVRGQIISGFDGSSSKDGNVWGRLLGFTRFKWARALGMDKECVDIVKSLPEEAQMMCLVEFDPSGTKDGNVAGRLQGFVKKALARTGHSSSAMSHVSSASPAAYGVDPRAQNVYDNSRSFPKGKGKGKRGINPAIADFIARCGLDDSATSFLEGLPEDVLDKVLTQFDPSGTKDGNVMGRLEGYVRCYARRASSNSAAPRNVSAAPPMAYDDSSSFRQAAGDNPDIADFLNRCGLDESATSLLEELPQEVLEKVLNQFDPSGTKDGNVLGRLQGYVRFLSARHGRGQGSLVPASKRPRYNIS